MFLVILRKKNYIKYHRHIYVCNPSAKELLYLSILLRATFIASTDSSAFLIVSAIAFFSFFPPANFPQPAKPIPFWNFPGRTGSRSNPAGKGNTSCKAQWNGDNRSSS